MTPGGLQIATAGKIKSPETEFALMAFYSNPRKSDERGKCVFS